MQTVVRWVLVVGVVLLAGTAGQAAEDAQAIVDRAIKAHGGEEKLSKLVAEVWKAKGVMTAMGMKFPYTAEYVYARPNRFRFDMTAEFGGMKIDLTVASDGKTAWQKGMGKVEEMPRDKFTEFQHNIYAINLCQLLPLKDKNLTLAAVGESKVLGKPALGVKVSQKGHRDVTLYFDKGTGLLVKSETRVVSEFSGKEVTQATHMVDYKEKGGNLYFHKMIIHHDGEAFIEEEFSDQQSKEKVDPKLFDKP